MSCFVGLGDDIKGLKTLGGEDWERVKTFFNGWWFNEVGVEEDAADDLLPVRSRNNSEEDESSSSKTDKGLMADEVSKQASKKNPSPLTTPSDESLFGKPIWGGESSLSSR